jgi:hypothetical protein
MQYFIANWAKIYYNNGKFIALDTVFWKIVNYFLRLGYFVKYMPYQKAFYTKVVSNIKEIYVRPCELN